MEAMFAICKAQGIRCGLLDLPRTDVNDEADWIDYVDGPHERHLPNQAGRHRGADALLRPELLL